MLTDKSKDELIFNYLTINLASPTHTPTTTTITTHTHPHTHTYTHTHTHTYIYIVPQKYHPYSKLSLEWCQETFENVLT